MPTIPLFGRGYSSKSPTITAQKLVNMYRQMSDDPDKSAMSILGTPGLQTLTTLGSNPSRGMRAMGSFIYSVHGNTLYRVQDAAVLGTLSTSTGLVSMSDNGTQLMIVDGSYGYIFTPGGSFAQIADVDFVAGNTVTFIAGYFVTDGPSGQFHWSALYDGTSWAPLDFATAESDPDGLLAVIQVAGELYLLGERTTEVWAPSTDGSVFRRVVGAGIDWGIAAVRTLDKFDGGFVFLAKNRMGECQLVKMQGYQVIPLSGSEEDNAINARSVASATGFSYMIDGHAFYQLNFPDLSMLYDAQTKSWSNVSSGAAGSRHYGETRTEFLSVPYVSDYRNGKIYAVSKNIYTDAGDAILRSVTSRHVFKDFERISIYGLYVDMQTGIGLSTGQGSTPQVMMQISRDNGQTWGNERWQAAGRQGRYWVRVAWLRLGMARDFVIRLKMSDPVPWVITAASVDMA